MSCSQIGLVEMAVLKGKMGVVTLCAIISTVSRDCNDYFATCYGRGDESQCCIMTVWILRHLF
jgi:hypothetical protein